MSIQPRVTVIVVNYNSGPYLARCLDSLGRHTFDNLEVVVVDNGSTDGSLEAAMPDDRRFRGVWLGANWDSPRPTTGVPKV